MPRSVRIEYPGAFYHVMARGNRREDIFKDEIDREFFLKALGEACTMTGWRVHAWVLMSHHYHLFVETPELVPRQRLLAVLTSFLRFRHAISGSLAFSFLSLI
jgi:REP element-mobilizing transposase RayT